MSGQPASHPPWSANRKEDPVRQSTARPPYRRLGIQGAGWVLQGDSLGQGPPGAPLWEPEALSSTREAVGVRPSPPQTVAPRACPGLPKSHGELSGEGQLGQEQKNQMVLSALTMDI